MAATRVTCLICGKPGPREDFEVIELTEHERAALINPLDEYPYCRPCWKVISDPAAGPALMSGIAQHHLQQAGVAKASELAASFRQSLIARALEKRN